MKKILKPAALLAITVFTLASCKKEETPNPGGNGTTPPPAPTKTELLTAKTWKLGAATVSPAMMGQTDAYSMMDACEKDNTLKFNASKNVTIDEGAKKCDSMDPQSSTKTWAFSGDETQLTIGNNNYKLESISATTLKISHAFTYNGMNYTLTETYNGQ